MKALTTLFITTFIIASCAPPAVDLDNDIKPLLRSNWDSFIESWEQEDASTCASLYLEDGINIPPEWKDNDGRKEVEEFYQFLFDNNISSEYAHDIISVSGDDQNVIEMGKFKVDWTRNDSTTWTYHARTMTHWVNNEGDWKIKSFLFNNPPAD